MKVRISTSKPKHSTPSTSERKATFGFGWSSQLCLLSSGAVNSSSRSSQTKTTGDSRDHHLSNTSMRTTHQTERLRDSSTHHNSSGCTRLVSWFHPSSRSKTTKRSTSQRQVSTSPWRSSDNQTKLRYNIMHGFYTCRETIRSNKTF